jgi:hypothetical protein
VTPQNPAQPAGREAELAAARSLFFGHDGSAFFMDMDSVRAQFQAYRVPDAVLAEWERERLSRRLAALDAAGNWRTVHSLCHHGHLQYLPRLLATAPSGRLWECCAYLEELLKYLDDCAAASSGEPGSGRAVTYTPADLRSALQTVISRAEALRGRPRSAKGHARVQAIIAHAQARLAVLDDPRRTPTGWHWNPLTGTAS